MPRLLGFSLRVIRLALRPALPAGHVFLVDNDGLYLLDLDGAFLIAAK